MKTKVRYSMTDVFEQASEREQLERDLAIRFSRKTAELPYSGSCYFCEHDLPPPMRFCDSFCRDDHEKEEEALKRNGGKR